MLDRSSVPVLHAMVLASGAPVAVASSVLAVRVSGGPLSALCHSSAPCGAAETHRLATLSQLAVDLEACESQAMQAVVTVLVTRIVNGQVVLRRSLAAIMVEAAAVVNQERSWGHQH